MSGSGSQSGMFDDALELEMFDMVAEDLIHGVDIPAILWKKRGGADVDPIYGDFNKELYKGPYEIHANATDSFSKMLTVDSDAGIEATRESEIWVSRKECERVDFGFIESGDIICFLVERLPSAYYFFIQNAHQTGRLPQGRAFIMWRLEIRYISKFDPEDLVDGEEDAPCITKNGRRID